MAFDVKKVVGEIVDDLQDKAQEMLDSSQVDDRIAAGFRKVADALNGLAGRVDKLDTDTEGEPETEPKTDPPSTSKAKEHRS